MGKRKEQKDNQWYAKLCTENQRSSHTNTQKNGVIHVWCFRRGQFRICMCDPPCYSVNKSGDRLYEGEQNCDYDKRIISVVICDTDIPQWLTKSWCLQLNHKKHLVQWFSSFIVSSNPLSRKSWWEPKNNAIVWNMSSFTYDVFFLFQVHFGLRW